MRTVDEYWVPLRSHGGRPVSLPLKAAYEAADVFVTALCLLTLILTFLCRTSRVEGASMLPTLRDRQILLVSVYEGPLRHGDIAVVSGDGSGLGKPIVKRVVGLPGDVIDIDFGAGVVYRNGEPLDEPYTAAPTNREEGMRFPLTVEPGRCFLLGDNRNNSTDSRSPRVGQVDRRDIMRVIFPILKGP